jgi:hypothetical protein
MLDQDGVDDVGAVIAVARLEKELGEDELGGRRDPHRRAIHLRLVGLAEPLVGDRNAGRGDVEDDVEEVLALPDLPDPALILDLNLVALLLEEAENLGRVAGLAEDVQVLGRPDDPGEAGQGVGARQEEGYAGFLEKPQGIDVEA